MWSGFNSAWLHHVGAVRWSEQGTGTCPVLVIFCLWFWTLDNDWSVCYLVDSNSFIMWPEKTFSPRLFLPPLSTFPRLFLKGIFIIASTLTCWDFAFVKHSEVTGIDTSACEQLPQRCIITFDLAGWPFMTYYKTIVSNAAVSVWICD